MLKSLSVNPNNLPLEPVLYGIDLSGSTSHLIREKVRVFYEFLFRLESYDTNFIEFNSTINHNIRIVYELLNCFFRMIASMFFSSSWFYYAKGQFSAIILGLKAKWKKNSILLYMEEN